MPLRILSNVKRFLWPDNTEVDTSALNAFIHTPPTVEYPPVYEPIVKPEIERRFYPPILMRLGDVEQISENYRQFFDYGWRQGRVSSATAFVDKLLMDCHNPEKDQFAQAYNIRVGEDLYVYLQSLRRRDEVEYFGKQLVMLYLPGDEVVHGHGFPFHPVTGGPTATLLGLIQQLSLELNLKIIGIEGSVGTGMLITFTPIQGNLQLKELVDNIELKVRS